MKTQPLPSPSFAPPLLALGLMLVLWGLLTGWLLSVLGLLLTGYASILWLTGQSATGIMVEAAGSARRVSGPELNTQTRSAPWRLAFASPWIHRYAVILCAFTLAGLILGALVTSSGTAASPSLHLAHWILGAIGGLLALGLAICIRGAAWILPCAAALEAACGSRAPAVAALHAFLAHLFFAGTVALAVITSGSWRRQPERADDMARPSMRWLAMITVGLVLVQIGLGSAVRHKLMGSGLHITFALAVALMIVCVGVLVCNHCAQHRTLRPCAVMMMVITGAQVFLGFGAFIMRMMAEENTLPVMISTAAHVTTGALTLAATVVLALQLRRHLRPAVAQKEAAVS